MEKIRLSADTEINADVINYIIDNHKSEKARVEKLNRYYKAKNDILDRQYKNKNKPQNRLANSYASYITNMAIGYFLGSPVSYKFEDEKIKEAINNNFLYNDESDINTSIAKQASIQGYAIELLYQDKDAKARFKPIQASEVALIFDNTLEENLLYAVRYYDEKDIVKDEVFTVVEVYDKLNITRYRKQESSLQLIEEVAHYFGDVPCIIYSNNDEYMGDFERVLDLIDAYDKTQSDTANDFEMFTHAMLVVSGHLLDDEDREGINDKYIINFTDTDGKAEYLIKNIQDAALENYKNRIDNDIHKFSQIPNMSDEAFANNSSGVSLQFKLMAIENITGIKEAKFKKGLMRRIELLCNYMKVANNSEMNYLTVEPVFTRTKPVNEKEFAEMMQVLTGILSEETILSISPFVDDVAKEMERKKEELKQGYEDNYSALGVEEVE